MADNTSDFFSAKAFRDACDGVGITKKAIAAELGVTPTTLSSLYRGRSTPSLKLLTKMVEFFGGQLVDFLEMPDRWELKHFRIAAGLTQAALAQRLEVAPSAVSGWELGKYSPPAALIPVLADLYGVPEAAICAAVSASPAAKPSAEATLQLAETVLEFASTAVAVANDTGVGEAARRAMFTQISHRVEETLILLAPLIPELSDTSRSQALSLVRRLSDVLDTATFT